MEDEYSRLNVKDKQKQITLKNTMNAGDQINEKFYIKDKQQDHDSSENELGLEIEVQLQKELNYEDQFEHIFSSRN